MNSLPFSDIYIEALRKTKEIKCSVMVGQDVVEFKTVLRGKADKE